MSLGIEKIVGSGEQHRLRPGASQPALLAHYSGTKRAQAFRYDCGLVKRLDIAMHQPYSTVPAYTTKDGSEIRELMHPRVHGNRAQSLAEATVPAGTRTLLHRHAVTEELYHITAGGGLMTLGDRQFRVVVGDTVLIAPGTPHCIEAVGNTPLVLLCCCSPAYAHADTQLIAESVEIVARK